MSFMRWMWHHHHGDGDRRGPPWGPDARRGPPCGPDGRRGSMDATRGRSEDERAFGPGGPRGPFGRAVFSRGGPAAFVRARLHRRIFAWFGISILITGITLVGVAVLVDRTSASGTMRELARANAFMAGQFAKVWDDPGARTALAREMASDFEVRVEVKDAAGVMLVAAFPDRAPFASKPCGHSILNTRVVRGGAALGEVRVCMDPRRQGPWWPGIMVGVTGMVLWAASGRIARRLARPLGDLARVAEELGRGKLTSRVPVGCYEAGEVAVVAEAMNDMAARIQKQLDDQRELLATVSHELRTPLSRIRLLTEIARDGGDAGHAFDEIDREVVEIDQLVAELLASSRLDFSALTTKEISAKEAAQRAVSRAGLDAEAVVHVVPGSGAPRVSVDPTLLARALANLLDNAAHHGGGAKKVVVRNGGGTVAFEVEDEGPGLAPGEEERIFEAFYQGTPGGTGNGAGTGNGTAANGNGESASGESASGEPVRGAAGSVDVGAADVADAAPKKGALGLGLALVRRIAEAHGGRTYAENRAEGGARFVLELPVKGPAAVA